MITDDLTALRDQFREGVRHYVDGEGPERTQGTKQAAEALVAAREHFTTREGEPDILGRSMDYRNWVAEATDDANVPAAMRSNLQAAIRHHVSPALRARYGEDRLEALGLKPGSTVERTRRRRARDARTLSMFTGGAPVDDVDDALLIANAARVACMRIQPLADGTADADRRLAADNLRRLARAANDAARRVEPPA